MACGIKGSNVYTYEVFDSECRLVASYTVGLAPSNVALWPLIVRRFPNASYCVQVEG